MALRWAAGFRTDGARFGPTKKGKPYAPLAEKLNRPSMKQVIEGYLPRFVVSGQEFATMEEAERYAAKVGGYVQSKPLRMAAVTTEEAKGIAGFVPRFKVYKEGTTPAGPVIIGHKAGETFNEGKKREFYKAMGYEVTNL